MHPTVKAIIDPRKPAGGWFAPHVLVIVAAVALIAFVAGMFAGAKFDASYYAHKYPAPLKVITRRVQAPRLRTAAPPAASLTLSAYPAVGDQGSIGSCAAYAAAWAMSYEYRLAYHDTALRFSPRWLYDIYSDANSGGQDAGSNFGANVREAAAVGAPRFKKFPYPPYVVDASLPTLDVFGANLRTDALRYKFPWSSQTLTVGQGGGQGVVDAIKAHTTAGQPVGIAFPVWNEYDNASAQPLITSPTAQEVQQEPQGRGGHENVVIAYNDALRFPDGTVGGVEVQNQWSTSWGNAGRAWLSYDFLRRFVFETASVQLGAAAPPSLLGSPVVKAPETAPGPADGGNGSLHAPPSHWPRSPKAASQAGASWYVQGVRLTTGQNISGLLNAWGDHYHVWPIGLAATAGVESGLNPYAERFAGGLDNSCGLMQQILTNVAYYTGIQGARAECNWEESPANSIYLGARIYAEAFAYQHNCVPWPYAYGLYNRGAGLPCAYYFNPAPDVYQHLQVFIGWYNLALSRWQLIGPPPPAPNPKPVHHYKFPKRTYEQYRRRHHRKPISPYYHHKLSFAASTWWTVQNKHGREVLGGILRREQFNHRRQVMTTSYQCGKIFTWPTHRGWTPKVARHRCTK